MLFGRPAHGAVHPMLADEARSAEVGDVKGSAGVDPCGAAGRVVRVVHLDLLAYLPPSPRSVPRREVADSLHAPRAAQVDREVVDLAHGQVAALGQSHSTDLDRILGYGIIQTQYVQLTRCRI